MLNSNSVQGRLVRKLFDSLVCEYLRQVNVNIAHGKPIEV